MAAAGALRLMQPVNENEELEADLPSVSSNLGLAGLEEHDGRQAALWAALGRAVAATKKALMRRRAISALLSAIRNGEPMKRLVHYSLSPPLHAPIRAP